ncbi:hypothetical protein [Rhodobacter lacus]|uniref:Uncharacterized protein n=1 Tax=Rhodobacter lacus TaxID=1641972 RepID=A0ABW5ABI4_9RHOB
MMKEDRVHMSDPMPALRIEGYVTVANLALCDLIHHAMTEHPDATGYRMTTYQNADTLVFTVRPLP